MKIIAEEVDDRNHATVSGDVADAAARSQALFTVGKAPLDGADGRG